MSSNSSNCAVAWCQASGSQMFQSPEDPDLLEKWMPSLNIDAKEFQVCGRHFDAESFEVKKFLKAGAVPTIGVAQTGDECCCQCCYKLISPTDLKVSLNSRHKEILRSVVDVEVLELDYVCIQCHETISKFDEFREVVKVKHQRAEIKLEDPERLNDCEILTEDAPLDPFDCDDFIKHELPSDAELNFEPEVKIDESSGSVESFQVNLRHRTAHDKISVKASPCETRKLICDICCEGFKTKNSLLRHIRDHLHDDDQQESYETHTSKKSCPICHKRMKSHSIHAHIKLIHKRERNQICQVCGKDFRTSYDLNVHLRKHSGERPEICETCGKTFISYSQLYKHRKIRHMTREIFQCEICLKNLLSRFKLKCHMQRFHKNGLDNGIRVNVETNCYHCPICPSQFIAMHKYETHLMLNDCQNYEGITTIEDLKLARNAKGEFRCQECGSILNTMKGLKKHMRFVHPKEPQSCKICFKQLKNPHTLWQHMTLSHKQPVKKRKIS